eukprot:5138132-Amphidinium_carterae.1
MLRFSPLRVLQPCGHSSLQLSLVCGTESYCSGAAQQDRAAGAKQGDRTSESPTHLHESVALSLSLFPIPGSTLACCKRCEAATTTVECNMHARRHHLNMKGPCHDSKKDTDGGERAHKAMLALLQIVWSCQKVAPTCSRAPTS